MTSGNHGGHQIVEPLQLTTTFVCLAIGLIFALPETTRCSHVDYYAYLELPGAASLGQIYHRDINAAIAKLNIVPGDSPMAILAKIERAKLTEPYQSIVAIYEQLLSMSDGLNVCPDSLLVQSKYILALIKNETLPAVGLKPFMRQFGREKFDSCARRANGYFHIMLGLAVEPALDRCFAAALGSTDHSDDVELYEKLKVLDLSRDRIDVNAMARVAEDYEPKNHASKNVFFTLVTDFLDDKCGKLQKMLGAILDQLNLARIFGSEELGYRPKLLKMNEHQRLCIAFRNPTTRVRILNNFWRSFGHHSKFGVFKKISRKVKKRFGRVSG